MRPLFHIVIQDWFEQTFGQPTKVQTQAWEQIKLEKNTLIAAPTGSGKTLAAFLAIIDTLICRGLKDELPEGVQVVYVSPLKALSNDIERNLQIPLHGIAKALQENGLPEIKIRAMVRTGDTTITDRTNMIKNPPHILVTTPESLYLLLTSKNGRRMLQTTRTLIIDEIHALVGDKRGSHLALSVERLEALTQNKLLRIGVSATQKPIEQVARFLVGNTPEPIEDVCAIINTGHRRKMELTLELPDSPLTAVMANEVWAEIYTRLVQLIQIHQTTLIFVNTRRMAERVAFNLAEIVGEGIIMAHHGSMSKDHRLEAEQRLKAGRLKALVATASLELGIDIGSVDLVCQIGAPRSISGYLQRVGRSGHSVKGLPKGKLFPLNCEELVEAIALMDAIRQGELDHIVMPEKPLDILSQQIVAETVFEDYEEDRLFELFSKAYPYRHLSRKEFDDIVTMLSEGFTTRNGRRSAHIHHDVVNGKLRARKGAGLTALLCGGAIPDNFDYDIILEPENTFIGTLNEDFAIESLPGDIFQLGNNSWKIMKVETGRVIVQDAQGQPPSIPFWLGEAPGRSDELSFAVSRFREGLSEQLGDLSEINMEDEEAPWKSNAMVWLERDLGIDTVAADQVVMYLATAKAALGLLPSQNDLFMERFFDEAGDMHLVIHSVFGSRINKAWGLALRKRFCKKFNFELQAAATENCIILSLGSTHSFPIEEVYQYLSPQTVRGILVQALLDAPMFGVRWRWNASRALAVPKRFANKKVPPQIQRSMSEDLVALVFPDQLACLENIVGEREVPDHPLVQQTIHDCLTELMDIEGLEKLLSKIKSGQIRLHARDLREASPLAQEVLTAKPYAFLDDAPLEERRTNAIQTRRWISPAEAKDLGKLDIEAVNGVKEEAWPQAQSPDELHDALVLCGYITQQEGDYNAWLPYFDELIYEQRATRIVLPNMDLWVATERLPQFLKLLPQVLLKPKLEIPEKILLRQNNDKDPLVEIIRGRLEALGPVRVQDLAHSLSMDASQIMQALLALENEGFVFRGHFTPEETEVEWCERRLLARIHRYTLRKLRSEIEPVAPSEFMRFLFSWHHITDETKQEGPEALRKALQQLEGFEAQAAAWESDIIPARISDYDYMWLDVLCLSGQTTWGRFKSFLNAKSEKVTSYPIKTTPIALISRTQLGLWKNGSFDHAPDYQQVLSREAFEVYTCLKDHGASFFNDILTRTKLFKSQLENALSELVAASLITSDSFTGLRALLLPEKHKTEGQGRRSSGMPFSMENAGRWSLFQYQQEPQSLEKESKRMEQIAKVLLNRYGVLFRKVIEREPYAPAWRDLVRTLRKMEDRGEVRGGRFITGVWGEQFALSEAITLLRSTKKEEKANTLVTISASDPLNLTGIITPGRLISTIFSNRILYRDGVPIAVKEGKEVQFIVAVNEKEKWMLQNQLIQRNISPKLKVYLGKGIY